MVTKWSGAFIYTLICCSVGEERLSLIIGSWDLTVSSCFSAGWWGPHPCRQSPQTICPHIPSSQNIHTWPTNSIPSKSAFSAPQQANSAAINTKHTYLHRNKSPLSLPNTDIKVKNVSLMNVTQSSQSVMTVRLNLRFTLLKHKAPSSKLHAQSEWDKQTYTLHIYQFQNALSVFTHNGPLLNKQKTHETLSVINISLQSDLLIIGKLNSPSLLDHDMWDEQW